MNSPTRTRPCPRGQRATETSTESSALWVRLGVWIASSAKPASEMADQDAGCGLPTNLATSLKKRDSNRLGTGYCQGRHVEGLVADVNDAQQGLRVSCAGVADESNLTGLRESET